MDCRHKYVGHPQDRPMDAAAATFAGNFGVDMEMDDSEPEQADTGTPPCRPAGLEHCTVCWEAQYVCAAAAVWTAQAAQL